MGHTVRVLFLISVIALLTGLGAHTPGIGAGLVYTYRAGGFVPFPDSPAAWPAFPSTLTCSLHHLPASWHVRDALPADLTGDGAIECVLLVWRPWRDWPIMRWSDTPSPVATHRDASGDSAHIILMDPATGREVWAGSALALPVIAMAAADVDADGGSELVALEGDYGRGREGPARYIAVWEWNGFGFTLQWRSPPGRFLDLALADLDGDGVPEILAR